MSELLSINKFVRRQTADSPFTHFDGSDERLLGLVLDALSEGKDRPGYREGVILVEVDPTDFYTGLVILEEGDLLVGRYEARQEGETPRKNIRVKRHGIPPTPQGKYKAKRVDIVLYSYDTLLENDENDGDAEWQIISINGFPTDEEAPINPMTLMHNHFGSDGGTDTNMTPEEFEAAMREAFNYFKDKAMLDI